MKVISVVVVLLASLLLGCEQQTSEPLQKTLQIDKSYQSKSFNGRVRFLVIHYTAIDWQRSITALTEGRVSSHYLIPESHDGSYHKQGLSVFQLVEEEERAWHAGRSQWQDRTSINDQSIGIELVNKGWCHYQNSDELDFTEDYYCFYPDYDPKQIELLIALAKDILQRNPDIHPTRIVGHSDIQPGNKSDPGPRFPWYTLYQHGIGAWYENDDVLEYWQAFHQAELPDMTEIQCGLKHYGYGIEVTGEYNEQTHDVIRAFQLHFTPWLVSGEPDIKTLATLWALLKKYRHFVLLDGSAQLKCDMFAEDKPSQ